MRTVTKPQVKKFNEFIDLLESVDSNAKEIEDKVDFEELEDLDPNKLAVVLQELIKADGNLDKVDIDHIEECYPQMLEELDEEDHLNESAGLMMDLLTLSGTVVGNMALVHFICQKMQKKIAKKIDEKEVQRKVIVIIEKLKNITGAPAKAVKDLFAWLAKKSLKTTDFKAEITGLAGLAAVVVGFYVLGVSEMPEMGHHIAKEASLSTVLSLSFGITALIGKTLELWTLSKEVGVAVAVEVKDLIGGREATTKEMETAIGKIESKGGLTIGV